MNDSESSQGLRTLLLMLLSFFVGSIGNWLSMLINSIRQSRVGWAIALFFLSPLACWIYYLFIYVPKSGNYIKRIDRQ